jgi:hypothetical protein
VKKRTVVFTTLLIVVIPFLLSSCISNEYEYISFTLPEGDIQLVFSAAADMRDYTGDKLDYFRNTCEQIAVGGSGSFMVSPGDIDPPERTLYTIRKYIRENYIWYPVTGNHEAETTADMNWLRSFNPDGQSLPKIVNGGPSGSVETTYSFDYGDTHFIVLNEYYDGSSDTGTDGDITDPLYTWLIDDLNRNTKPIILVFGHEPAYPKPDAESGRARHTTDSLNKYSANRDRFWNTLVSYGVRAYVCGHTHNYSALLINGVWQIDVGHARGTGDTGSRSTFVMFYILENGDVWFYTYRLNLNENKWELTDYNKL